MIQNVRDCRADALEELGRWAPTAAGWFDALPESGGLYRALLEDEASRMRVGRVLEHAPALVATFRRSRALTEALLSDALETDGADRIAAVTPEAPPKTLALTAMEAHTSILAQWALTPDFPLEPRLAALADALLRHCAARLYAGFDIIALGSYGAGELSPGSDIDLLLLVDFPDRLAEAESGAAHLLALLASLRRYGAPVEMDVHLRPPGGLVRTYAGLKIYDFEGMGMDERFALGNARVVVGADSSLSAAQHVAYALPLTPERLRELARLKRRLETERVRPQHVWRHLKHGQGGLDDIEWLVHLHEMRYPTATRAGETTDMEARIRALGRAQLVHALEVETLLDARRHLLQTRARLWLLGFSGDLVPENPDKLDRLAHASGDEGANAFLARHERHTESVRALYLESLERLRA